MLTQLQTLKDRLKITDVIDDDYLNRLISQCSDAFERYCNRKFARVEADTQEFRGNELECIVARYPVELVIGFELKSDEDTGWEDVADPSYVVRFDCIVSLADALGSDQDQARVIFTGGYVLPGTTPGDGQTALPADLEAACVEQCSFWYRNKALVGVSSASGGGSSVSFDPKSVVTPLALLPVAIATLEKYRRIQF